MLICSFQVIAHVFAACQRLYNQPANLTHKFNKHELQPMKMTQSSFFRPFPVRLTPFRAVLIGRLFSSAAGMIFPLSCPPPLWVSCPPDE